MRNSLLVVLGILACGTVRADGLGDNDPDQVRRLPKLGIETPAERRAELEAGLAKLRAALDGLRQRNDASTRELLPDVEIYYKAVHDALAYQEFYQPREFDDARTLLAAGQERAEQLLAGKSPWTTATGLVPRGYVSRIDGSVQPYGLVVPPSYVHQGPGSFRCDIWFHGRGEVLTELNFLRDRSANAGTFTPKDTLVLHPYGRWNNAFKCAGEIDVLEALASVQRRYRVDDNRISVRGFSMGGAAAWHFAVHYPDRWFAANPGAGFSETPEFLRDFQKETLQPTWWERRLWHMYDCNDWALNLFHCPTVAYSGDEDSQKQAADVMETALRGVGMDLVHVIGPQTKHSYHPQSRIEVDRRLDQLASYGRTRVPPLIQFVTYTLKYNRLHWLTVDDLNEHWQPATVRAELHSTSHLTVTTKNVTGLTLDFEPGASPFAPGQEFFVELNGTRIGGQRARSDRSWTLSLHVQGEKWAPGRNPEEPLRKRHNLQGPIDDAFMDSFIFVRPTGQARHAMVGKWSEAELARASEQWRRHFRGIARVKDDRAITEEDIAGANLVLWGDTQSNSVLARIAPSLPIRWMEQSIAIADRSYPADTHALIAIYPNPLNPARYVVLNSGFTFREYTHLNNARQVPVLPDWAVVDLRTPAGNVWPGKIVAADFFDESWELKSPTQP